MHEVVFGVVVLLAAILTCRAAPEAPAPRQLFPELIELAASLLSYLCTKLLQRVEKLTIQ